MEKAVDEIEADIEIESEEENDEEEMGRGMRKKRPHVVSSDEESEQPSISARCGKASYLLFFGMIGNML